MKQLLFALAKAFSLLLISTGIVHAQSETDKANTAPSPTEIYSRKAVKEDSYGKLYKGFRIGTTLAGLGNDASETTSNKVGLLVGGFIGMDVKPNLSLQIGLNYVKKGAKIDSDSLDIGINIAPTYVGADTLPMGAALTANYNYISIPVNVRYFPSEKHGLFFLGGASASLLIKSEILGVGGNFIPKDGRFDVKDQLNSIDFGFQAGIGYEWTELLEISLLYEYGFANTLSNSEQNLNVNNRGWQFALGFKF